MSTPSAPGHGSHPSPHQSSQPARAGLCDTCEHQQLPSDHQRVREVIHGNANVGRIGDQDRQVDQQDDGTYHDPQPGCRKPGTPVDDQRESTGDQRNSHRVCPDGMYRDVSRHLQLERDDRHKLRMQKVLNAKEQQAHSNDITRACHGFPGRPAPPLICLRRCQRECPPTEAEVPQDDRYREPVAGVRGQTRDMDDQHEGEQHDAQQRGGES